MYTSLSERPTVDTEIQWYTVKPNVFRTKEEEELYQVCLQAETLMVEARQMWKNTSKSKRIGHLIKARALLFGIQAALATPYARQGIEAVLRQRGETQARTLLYMVDHVATPPKSSMETKLRVKEIQAELRPLLQRLDAYIFPSLT